MFSKAHKRYRDEDIAKMQRYRWNPYKEALLNPISGPLVGVPTTVPIDTFRQRIKASFTFTSTGGQLTILANPVAALCNDGVPIGATVNNLGAAILGSGNASITTIDNTINQILSNSPYFYTDFVGVSPSATNTVRGRVVSACLRVCNITADATRNGVFTLFKSQTHDTLQGVTADSIKNNSKTRQYNASTTDWHNILYHPVHPEEVDGWVWDPRIGPQAGVTTTAQNPGGTGDGTEIDTQPGYMGVWWNGIGNQQFQVELYVIAEFVGTLVKQSTRENEAKIEDAHEGRHATENMASFSISASRADNHTGHPHSATRAK